MRRHNSSKPKTCTEDAVVDAVGISVKVGVHYPGRSVGLPCANCAVRRSDESTEVSSGQSRTIAIRLKAQTFFWTTSTKNGKGAGTTSAATLTTVCHENKGELHEAIIRQIEFVRNCVKDEGGPFEVVCREDFKPL